MNIENLWIGDVVFLVSANENVVFEGRVDENSIKVKIGSQRSTVRISDIEEARKELIKKADGPETLSYPSLKPLPSSIDLHYEKLFLGSPKPIHAIVLQKQINAFRQYIDTAISLKVNMVTIIHGKGEGVLRAEVRNILKDLKDVKFFLPVNDDGATEVWFRYF